jgi:putative chitinase
MVTLTAELLRDTTQCSLSIARVWVPHVNEALYLFGIDAPARAAAFLAQVSHESGQLSRVRESLHYSTAARLCAVWPSRFPTIESALPFAGQPEALGDKVYGGRMGNTQPGDGLRYCGRGPIQVTGRAGYVAARDGLRSLRFGLAGVPDFEAVPHELESPRWGALSAGLFWHANGLSALADAGRFDDITCRINGVRKIADANGAEDRRKLHKLARRALMGVA